MNTSGEGGAGGLELKTQDPRASDYGMSQARAQAMEAAPSDSTPAPQQQTLPTEQITI